MKTIEKLIKKEKIEFIDLKYIGLPGTLHHITVPVDRYNYLTKEGIGIDGSSIPGFKGVKKCDMIIMPDLDNYFIDPFFRQKTLSFFCRTYYPKEKEQFEKDPQNLVTRLEDYLRRKGLRALFLPELEFYLFDSVEFSDESGNSFYRTISSEAIPDEKFPHTGYRIKRKGGYHITPPYDRTYNFRNELTKILSACGIEVKYHHHEVGPASQVEIELVFNETRRTCNNIVLSKYLIKNAAQVSGFSATFMPKPLYGEPGNGMHLHHYLTKDNRSQLFDQRDITKLTKFGEYYIAGLLEHTPALCALTNPTTNSYKRLISGYEAPIFTDWAVGSRASAIRIPEYVRDSRNQRLEYRIPDAMANPHLALPAIILAGLDGVERRLRLSEKRHLPGNLLEALMALKKDNRFLLKGDIFNEEIINQLIETKITEYEAVMSRPNPQEYILYFGG